MIDVPMVAAPIIGVTVIGVTVSCIPVSGLTGSGWNPPVGIREVVAPEESPLAAARTTRSLPPLRCQGEES